MKHETFNSIIAFLGLGLAAVTAWDQFGPKSDFIALANEGRIEVGRRLEIEPIGTIDTTTGRNQPVVGPVTWKIRVDNATDRPVSIVSFDAFLLGENSGRIQYSTMRESLLAFDPAMSVQALPENIPPNESRAYLVSLFVPFSSDEDTESKCDDSAESLGGLERCFLQKGRDMFGNQVEVVDYGSAGISAQWTGGFSGPNFEIVLETADGSEFSTQLSFFPGL